MERCNAFERAAAILYADSIADRERAAATFTRTIKNRMISAARAATEAERERRQNERANAAKAAREAAAAAAKAAERNAAERRREESADSRRAPTAAELSAAEKIGGWSTDTLYQWSNNCYYGEYAETYGDGEKTAAAAAVAKLAISAAYTACKYVSMFDAVKLEVMFKGTPSGTAGKWIDGIKASIWRSEHAHSYTADEAAEKAAEISAAAANNRLEKCRKSGTAAELSAAESAAEMERTRRDDLKRRQVYAAESAAAAADDIISACIIGGLEYLYGVSSSRKAAESALYKHMYRCGRNAIKAAAADSGRTAARQAAEEAAESAANDETDTDGETIAEEKNSYQQYAAESAAADLDSVVDTIADSMPSEKSRLIWRSLVNHAGNVRKTAFDMDISDDVVYSVRKIAGRIAVQKGFKII